LKKSLNFALIHSLPLHSFTNSLIHAIDKSSKQPVYLQIAGALSEHIRRGAIPAGSQLPGSRQLAESLNLHRKTVLAAYEELLAQGWLETRRSKGTYVSERLPDILHAPLSLRNGAIHPKDEAGYDFERHPLAQHLPLRSSNALGFNDGFPDVRIAPWDALSRAYRTALRQGFRKNLLFYGDTAGEPA
jgi:GntR family transcriptional regulator/MocR family aminotransferase